MIDYILNIGTENFANILIYIAGIMWGIELIPQIIKTYKTKNIKGISITFFITCCLAYIIYTIGNIMLKNWIIVIAHIPSIILLIVEVILIILYKQRRNRKWIALKI